jgi:hypothetical protein
VALLSQSEIERQRARRIHGAFGDDELCFSKSDARDLGVEVRRIEEGEDYIKAALSDKLAQGDNRRYRKPGRLFVLMHLDADLIEKRAEMILRIIYKEFDVMAARCKGTRQVDHLTLRSTGTEVIYY